MSIIDIAHNILLKHLTLGEKYHKLVNVGLPFFEDYIPELLRCLDVLILLSPHGEGVNVFLKP